MRFVQDLALLLANGLTMTNSMCLWLTNMNVLEDMHKEKMPLQNLGMRKRGEILEKNKRIQVCVNQSCSIRAIFEGIETRIIVNQSWNQIRHTRQGGMD